MNGVKYMAKSMFDIIKNKHGEAFAKELRDFDNGIFEIPDLVQMLKYAGYEAAPIKEYLSAYKWQHFSKKGKNKPQNPFDLLKKVGYRAFYVDSLQKQMSIQKYFTKETALCTFNDEERFQKYHIIYCIKEGAEKLKPAKNPMREDEFATSVISIQILKEGGFLKITNRYNHMVENPDNTFNSNPDRIVPGLIDALEGYFKNITIVRDSTLPNGYVFYKNKLIQVNEEIANTFISENCYLNEKGEFITIDTDKEMIIDNFVFNLKNRGFTKIINRIPFGQLDELLTKEFKGKALQLKSDKRGQKTLFADGIKILETNEGKLTFLNLPNAIEFKENFITFDRFLKYLFAPKVRKIGRGCLVYNRKMKHLHLPQVQEIASRFLMTNSVLETFSAPLLKVMDNDCFSNAVLKSVILPSLEYMGEYCFSGALNVERFIAPNLCGAKAGFLWRNRVLKDFYAPKFKTDMTSRGWADRDHLGYHSKQKKLFKSKNNIHKILKTPFWKRLSCYLNVGRQK